MSKGDTFENDLLKLIFNNTDCPLIGDATGLRGSTVAGSLYLSLHTADPGEAGVQTTNEVAYTGYARVAVVRSTAGFTVTGNSVSPFANVDFGACTAGPTSYSYWAIGTAASGAGKILYKGVIGANLGTFTALATDTITIPGLTGVAVNDNIAFFAGPGDTLPTGITEGVVYFVKTLSGNDITISTTSGGATLDITAAGKGLAMKVTPKAVGVGDIPRIPTTSTIVEN
ncbi:MAG: hypothetical protein V4659_04155 [Pseudomonadota bacterium]